MKKKQRNSFLTPLVVEVMPSGKRFRVYNAFTYRWTINHTYRLFTVPAGFVTDFASIPRIFRIIIPKLGRWNKAAVIHDYLYQNHKREYISRIHADQVFLAGMTDLGVARWKRYVMYWGVRVGGCLAWRKR